jgi:serine/threonine protein kinase
MDINSLDLVALKRVRIFDPLMGLPVSFTREITVLQTVSHPHIVELRDIVSDSDGSVYLALEYCEFDLSGLIHGPGLSRGQIQMYMRQLLSAVSVLHSHGFVHRDLKPANVFVTRANVLKLGDFGLSKHVRTARPLTQGVVTLLYRAPELLLDDPQYGCPVDVWSLACVFFEMITGERLFGPTGNSELGVLASILKVCGTPDEEDWPGVLELPLGGRLQMVKCYRPALRERLVSALPEEFHGTIDLFEGMLQMNPQKRITVEEALKHEFFREEVELPPLMIPECHGKEAVDVGRAVRLPENVVRPMRARAPPILA